MSQHTPAELVKQASTASILWGVFLILLGFLAIAAPVFAAVAVNALVAWLIILAGVIHLALAFSAHGAGSVLWKLLVGLAYLVCGGYLIIHPILGIASLTLLLAVLFLIEGVLDIILYFQMRSLGGSIWVLLDGIATLILGGLIYAQWPSSSAWAIGTLVGISLIISGVSRAMVSLAVRKTAAAVS